MDKSENNRQINRKFLFYLSLALIFILTSFIYDFRINNSSSPEKILKTLQADFNDAEKKLSVYLDSLAQPNYLSGSDQAGAFIRE
ncbi:MAG: hypothetical protein KAJ50_03280, partial [Bacteroidales bacterium]|nr:hypothetical protein [Bacteroidales bacterium]